MKKNLLLAALLIGLATLGIGLVALLPLFFSGDEAETVKPKTEVFAEAPKKVMIAPIKKAIKPVLKETVEIAEQIAMPMEKKTKLPEVVIEPKVEPKPNAKVLVLDPNIKLNDPEGEYILKPIHADKEVILLGVIKTLKLSSAGDRARIDATRLVAHEIIFRGNLNNGATVLISEARKLNIAGVNSGSLVDASANDADDVVISGNLNRSTVLLGKAKKLTISHVNDQSTLDGSKLDAQTIVVKGAINGGSIIKLHAPNGSVQFAGPINAKSHIDVAAPGGKVIFNVHGAAIITGDAKLKLLAKEIHLQGQIHGTQTQLNVTLSKDGFLAFERLNNGVQLHYRKADAADPEPRVNKGKVDAKAELRKLE